MRGAGLETRLDAVGNLFGRWEGSDPTRRCSSPARTSTRRSTPAPTTGCSACSARSRRCAPCVDEAWLRGARSTSWPGPARSRASAPGASAAARPRASSSAPTSTGSSTATARAWPAALSEAGFDPDRLDDARIDPAGVHALVELHIEQGIVLETHGEQVGVVTAIAAPHDFRLTFRGAATHAGATPMGLRRDALAGAAEAMVGARARRARVAERHDRRHRRRAPRAARSDQRRARRGRARRRRARQRPRRARAGGAGDRGGRARDRGPARPRGRSDPDRRGRAGDLRRGRASPPRRRRAASSISPCA